MFSKYFSLQSSLVNQQMLRNYMGFLSIHYAFEKLSQEEQMQKRSFICLGVVILEGFHLQRKKKKSRLSLKLGTYTVLREALQSM